MLRKILLASVLVLVHCSEEDGDASPMSAMDRGDLGTTDNADLALLDGGASNDGGRAAAQTFLLTLDAGAFPPSTEHPSALVYLPSGFTAKPPVSLFVYIHGFNNCVENIVRKKADGKACTPGGAVRNAYALIDQMEAAGKNAILLCPEVAFDQSTGNPGKLGEANGFRALLTEVLQKLSAPLGGLQIGGIAPVALASHSGGYVVAASIATQGGVPIDELYLLDSLYGNTADFESWIQKDVPGLAGATPRHRFAIVYTDTGSTLANSQAMATQVAGSIPDSSVLVDDRTTATWALDMYHHGLLFKHSMLSHDDVPRYYFETLLTTSSLAALK